MNEFMILLYDLVLLKFYTFWTTLAWNFKELHLLGIYFDIVVIELFVKGADSLEFIGSEWRLFVVSMSHPKFYKCLKHLIWIK